MISIKSYYNSWILKI